MHNNIHVLLPKNSWEKNLQAIIWLPADHNVRVLVILGNSCPRPELYMRCGNETFIFDRPQQVIQCTSFEDQSFNLSKSKSYSAIFVWFLWYLLLMSKAISWKFFLEAAAKKIKKNTALYKKIGKLLEKTWEITCPWICKNFALDSHGLTSNISEFLNFHLGAQKFTFQYDSIQKVRPSNQLR